MDILEVLDKVRELLQQEGRVSYRLLKRQYALDDEALEDLKFEAPRLLGDFTTERGTVAPRNPRRRRSP